MLVKFLWFDYALFVAFIVGCEFLGLSVYGYLGIGLSGVYLNGHVGFVVIFGVCFVIFL